MGCKKNICRMQAMMMRFCYEHRWLDCRIGKIRKNTRDLCRMLDSMPPHKEKEKGKEYKK